LCCLVLASGNIITGTGATLTGYGSIDVVGAALATQYAFTTPVYTNITVNYVGGGGTIAAGTYSSLTTSGSGITSLGGAVVVTGSVTIGTGTTLAAGTNSLQVSGNWTNNGTYTTGTALVTFNGTGGQTIGGTSGTTFSSLTIANTSAAVNISTSTNVSGTLTLNASTLIVPEETVVFNNSGATGTLTGLGTIKVTRVASVASLLGQYKFSTYTLTDLTVEYAGAGAQTINSTAAVVTNYGALTVSGSGTKTLQGNVTVINDIILTSGTVATGGFSITTSGSWLNNGVTFGGIGTINLNGTAKTISGTTLTDFPALVIGAGASYTMNNNNTCTGLTFTASGSASSFTHGSNNILTVNGNVAINQPTAAVSTAWNINASAVTVTGTFNIGGNNTTASRVSAVVITTGALTVNGATTITGSTTATNTLINMSGGAGALSFGGAITLSGASTLNSGTTSTVNYNGTVAQTIPFSTTFIYNNLNCANAHASGATFGGNVTAANLLGNLTVISGVLNTNNVAVALAGSKLITVADGATLNAGTTSVKPGSNATVTIDGTFKTANAVGFSGVATAGISSTNTATLSLGSNSTIEYTAGVPVTVLNPSGAALSYNNLTLSNTSGTNTASGNVVVNGILSTAAGGTFDLGNSTLSGSLPSITHNGTLTTTNNSGAPIPAGKTWGGTVNYSRSAGVQTIMAGTYNILTLSNTSGTQTAGGDITTGTLNNSTAGIILNMATYSLTATTITNNATATIRTQNLSSTPISAGLTIGGIVTYDAATAGQSIVGGTYSTLTMGNTSGTQTATGNITATTLLNNTSGITLDMTTYTLSGISTYTVNAGAILRTQNISATPLPSNKTWGGTIIYDAASGGQTVMMGTYNNLTISNTSGTQTASGAITSSGTFTNTVGGLLDMSTYALNVTTVANSGTITTAATGSPITSGKTWGGEIIYAGSGTQTIVAGNYNDLSSSSTGARILINGGTIAVAGSFSNGTNAYTITGNIFEYNGTGAQTIAAFNYNSITISGARGNEVINFDAGTIGIAGTFTLSASNVGSYDVSGNTVNFNGGTQTVPTATGLEYNNITLSGTNTKTTTGAVVNGIFSIEGDNSTTASVTPTFGPGATLQIKKTGTSTISTVDWPISFTGEGGVIVNVSGGNITLSNSVRAVSFSVYVITGGGFKVNLNSSNHTSNGLVLNGVEQVPADYTATSTPAYFVTGTGRIRVSSLVSTWNGSSGTTWSITSNWTPATVPTSTRDAVIPTGVINMPNMTGAVSCRNLTIGSGMTVTTNNNTVNLYGDYTNNGGAFNAGSSPIIIRGATNQNLNGFATTGTVTVSNATGDVVFNGTTSASSIIISASGVNIIANNVVTLSGALTVNNIANASVSAAISGSGSINCASVSIGNGTAPTSSNTTRTHTLTSTLANLIVSGDLTVYSYIGSSTSRRANGSFVHTSGLVSVGGILTINTANAVNAVSYTMGNSGPQLNLLGATPFTVIGAGTGTITLNGTGAIVNYKSTSAQAVRNTPYIILKINNTNASGASLTANATMTNLVIGDENISSIFNDAGFTITPNGGSVLDLVSGTYNLGNATATIWPAWATNNIGAGTTVSYNATSAQIVSTTPVYSNLTFTGANTKTITSGSLTVGGNWHTTASLASLLVNNASAEISGNITGTGPITSGSGTIAVAGGWTNNGTFTAGSGTVNYNGTGAQTIGALVYNNLVVSNSRIGSPVITMGPGTIKISGALTFSATGVGTYTVTGNTIEYSGAGAQTITPFNYNNLLLSGARNNASITLGSGSMSVGGTFSNTATSVGAYITTGNTFTYSALTGTQSIVPFVYNNLVLSNTSGTNTAAGNIVVDGTFTTAAGGTLQLGTFTLSGLLTGVTHNGIISTTNTSILPIAAGKTWAGTVVYNMSTGAQTIVAGTYGTLTQGHTSIYNSLSGDVVVNTALNFAASGTGKMVLGSNTLTLSGTIANMTAARCFVANGSSNIVINGTGSLVSDLFMDQTTGGITNRLNNLTYNRSSVTITLGDTVEVAGTITPTAGTLATSNKLKLVSNASGTARVVAGSGTYITGNVTVERYVPAAARRWRFMGATVSGTTFADLKNEMYLTGNNGATNGFDATASNQASIYSYDETVITGDFNTGFVAATNITNPITVGKGYRIFIRGDRSDIGRLDGSVTTQNAVTLNVIGPLNSGNISLPVSYTSSGTAANDGWNLVANPYACPVDWNALHDAGRTGPESNFSGTDYLHINPTVYIYNAITNSYTSYNALSNSGVGSMAVGIIPAGASFWVQAVAGSPSITIKEIYKTTSAPASVFKTANEQFTIQLIKDSLSSDELAIKYIDELRLDWMLMIFQNCMQVMLILRVLATTGSFYR
jgi:hypothetical protein